MQYFTVTMWNGLECFSLYPDKPPVFIDQKRVHYVCVLEVAHDRTLDECIAAYESSK